MRSKQLHLNHIQEQLAAKQRDYEDVSKEFGLATDPIAKNRHSDRLKALLQDIEALEQQESTLQQQLVQDADQSARAELARLLQFHASEIDVMQMAYRNVLRYRGWTIQHEPTTPDAIITQLLRIPKGQFGYEAVEELVAHLVTTTQTDDLILGLQNWGEQQLGERWADLLQKVTQQQVQPTQPALLIVMSRSDEASTQSESETHYQIRAWLIRDIQDYQTHRQGIHAIHVSGMTGDETYAQSDLPYELPRRITQFLANSHHLVDHDPELHLCLPLELMNYDIDLWQLDGDGPIRPCLGRRYKVVLRCTERWSRSYQQERIWKQKWKQHQFLLEKKAYAAFIAGDDGDLETLYYDLVEDAVVGLKVIQAPTCVGVNSLFGVLLQAGTPIAIWGRQNLKDMTNDIELDRILEVCCLKNLVHTVKEERQKARQQAPDAHIGHHLSLLWDDPYLVPPKSA